MTWINAPICAPCYDRIHPGRDPVRVLFPPEERCIQCDCVTYSGIYVRWPEPDDGAMSTGGWDDPELKRREEP